MDLFAKILSSETSEWNPCDSTLWVGNDDRFVPGEPQVGLLAPILNSLADGVLLTDRTGTLKIFNNAAVKLLGAQTCTLGKRVSFKKPKLFEPDQITPIPRNQTPIFRALQGEHCDRVEMFLLGDQIPRGIFVESSSRPIRNLGGEVIGAVSLFRDISKRKQDEEELLYNKRRFETMSHVINDYVWEWDVKRDVVCRHIGLQKGFGYQQVEVGNAELWWKSKIHPEDLGNAVELHRQMMAGKLQSYRCEYRYRTRTGSYTSVLCQTKVVRSDSEGRPTHIMGGAIDISERRAIEEKLIQLAAIVESTDVAIVSVDLNNTIVSWNGGAERLLGYPASEVIGKPVNSLPAEEGAIRNQEIHAKILKGESVHQYESWKTKKNGEKILLSANISPVRDCKGKIVGSCAIIKDITEKRMNENEINRLANNLQRSNRELRHFAYIASHDLIEPLRTVSSFVRLLKTDYAEHLDSRALQFIQYAVDGVERMRNLIESLLEYSKVEASPINLCEVDCGQLVELVKNDLKVAIEETNVKIIVGSMPTVKADAVQLSQLFQNLISNAIKFRRSGDSEIQISASQGIDHWLMSISDNGIGIKPDFGERIFQVFQRVHTRAEYPGAGLGLATAKKIVERHGGKIWFESLPGEGTTFFFTIPDLRHPLQEYASVRS
jgi:PAS domain S-box-containing protein